MSPHNHTAVNLCIKNTRQSLNRNNLGLMTDLTGLTAKQRKKLKRAEWRKFIAFMEENPQSLLDLTARVPSVKPAPAQNQIVF